MRIYAIGDIHGHLELLRQAHALIEADGGGTVVHIGDLVDRGPDACGVIDYLMTGQAEGRPWVVIRGNHDRMFADFLRDPFTIDPGLSSRQLWLEHPGLGAAATLNSYGVRVGLRPVAEVHTEALAAVPPAHATWLRGLPLWYRHPLALFVHAGIRPGIAIEDQTEDDLVWIRKGFLEDRRDHGVPVVHGHTAIKRATHYGNRLNIDSSAAYGGPLSAVVLTAEGAHLLTDQGRAPIPQEAP